MTCAFTKPMYVVKKLNPPSALSQVSGVRAKCRFENARPELIKVAPFLAGPI